MKTLKYLTTASLALSCLAGASSVRAQEAAPTSAPPAAPSAPADDGHWPRVGGHVGLALPIAHLGGTQSTTIGTSSDGKTFFTLAPAYGITVKLSKDLAVDFENVVGISLNPGGVPNGYTVDPGVVYNLGPLAIGGRVGFTVTDPYANVLLIPIVNKGFAIGDGCAFFVEADFPILFEHGQTYFSPTAHVGIGF